MKCIYYLLQLGFLKTNPDPSWRKQIRRHGHSYRDYYKCNKRVRPVAEFRDLSMWRRQHLSKENRFAVKEHLIGLAPNRLNLTEHNLAKIVQKSAGNKGPYACFTGKSFTLQTYCQKYLLPFHLKESVTKQV